MSVSLSYVSGASDEPLLYKTVGGVLEEAAARWGERDALIVLHQGVRLSYREFEEATRRLAAALLRMGLVPGDRVGIWSPNRYEWVLTQFATAKAGLILVNINPAYRLSELEFALNKVGCRALIMAAAFKSSDYVRMMQELAPEIASCAAGQLAASRVPDLRTVVLMGPNSVPGFVPFRDLESQQLGEQAAQLDQLRALLQPEDPINIQFTSGTTGLPKGATLSHHNIVNNGYFVARRMQFSEEDRLCIPVPLYHCFGMVMGVLGCVTHGAAMIFPSEGFEPESVLQAVSAERCTALYGEPTMFIAELGHPRFLDHDFKTLRTGVMAGAPCPVEVMKRVVSEMNMSQVTICYGMTETSPVSFQSRSDDSLERRVTTVGTIHPHLEVKVVDGEGRVVAIGERGELLTRGYSVMHGYWNDAERTAQVLDQQGWMHTGDLATLDEEGYCNIVGRVKDLIIRGGENISPREVEEFLYRHPAVQDVQVFGIPDAKYGEAVCAWIKLKPGKLCDAQGVHDFCRDQIAHFKVPQHVRFVDDLPMTVTGKMQKFVMRQRMIEELGIAEADTA